jgi:folylpolyglutamate synthase/dihydropteroate synthase
VAVLAILGDKDAAGMIEALAPAIGCAVCTELPADGPKSLDMERFSAHRRWTPAAVLAEACEAAGVPAEAEPDFDAALRRARELAAGPPPAALVVTGSHYVLAPARALLS